MNRRVRVRRIPTVALAGLLGAALAGRPASASAGERQERARWASPFDTLAIESHARFLASDLLEGRAPASRGERLAAQYLVSRLAGFGLDPLPGRDDYRLPVPLTAIDVDRAGASAVVLGDGRADTLRPPDFYHPGGDRSAFEDFRGELLFAGTGASARAALEGHDASGKVVVLTPPWEVGGALEEWLIRAGAAGALYLVPDPGRYERLRIARGPTRYALPDAVGDPANQTSLPTLVGSAVLIRALGVEGVPAADGDRAVAIPLSRSIEVHLPHTTAERTGYNVAARVSGADPRLRDEWVVYIAHYDHVGYGEPAAGDSLWNGFVDNAMGSAILLETARAMAADPPARSVAFLFVTAEEQGLLGSNWFVHEAPLPLDRVRAVVNVDGGAPPAPPVEWGLVGADASEAGRIARRVVERHGWTVVGVDIGPQSDHWPFHLANVPVTMLFPGAALDGLSEEEARTLVDRWLHPHTPDDEWMPGFPMAGVARYAELIREVGRTLAEAPLPPEVPPDSVGTSGFRALHRALRDSPPGFPR